MKNIRNFCIIAHIDHGKSTLADRMLEITGTIEARKMKEQALDSMELERERGITIKMTPVRMVYHPQLKIENSKLKISDSGYILNLIDTPGHIDFSYEVSRALKAVEGAVLLVDATQGVQAQTLSVLAMARAQGLVIIPALSKCDSPLARVPEVKAEIISLLGCRDEEIIQTSGKTGDGVEKLLLDIVEKIPAPDAATDEPLQALVFDFKYSSHRGIIVFARIMKGEVGARENLIFRGAEQKFVALEVGIFKPDEEAKKSLKAGETGYIVTGIKTPGIVSVGDTIGKEKEVALPLPGYSMPKPVVWASVFPEDQGELVALRQALAKLKLTDSSLFYEEESSGVLGKGFRCGFLGMLHLEIITERLKREFNLTLIITQPSITYDLEYKNGKKEKIFSPAFFPEDGLIEKIEEPWVSVNIIAPSQYVGGLLPLLYEYEAEIVSTDSFGLLESAQANKTNIHALMPLRELMRGFFDKLKSVSQGYASLSYEEAGMREANVTKLCVLVNGDEEPSLSRVVSKRIVEREAESIVEKLKNLLPRQMFELKIQGKALGRVISSRTISAFRKDVTQHMYGGDITRKMKLREKQKKGKKKMKERGKISIPQDVFIKIMRPD
ncbi:MAG: elongation factor 4 [Candidatus Zambryskibacteria bacterium RIFOXYC1_FULL_39_10]|uniref:Elongation factor 4 n=1 Tax=Candidatus Zambryskibacteria bacterium RIFOXYC1_FULL_39_10 TaxID=1802779 RepID=A0A1G2V3N0_9BACT|nr:MAG: elongation factor 4 [Candidatus Zambryskibacteria bacterium RIFOXYC1_FULL_39_10]OHB16709.1 MAG: elongation factor 4 [Candidatus Zambryskibacteria bacterium RIFOXYD1_FULL_39_35]